MSPSRFLKPAIFVLIFSVVGICYRPNYGRIFGRILTVEILAWNWSVGRIIANSGEHFLPPSTILEARSDRLSSYFRVLMPLGYTHKKSAIALAERSHRE